jgi:polyferredoxin/peroxiredoxin
MLKRSSFLFIFFIFFIGSLIAGEKAPNFIFQNEEGERITFYEVTKDVPALLFFVDTSEVSIEKTSEFFEIYEDYDSVTSLKIFCFVNRSYDGAQEFKEMYFIDYPVYGDEEGKIAKIYKIFEFPYIVIISKDKKIVYRDKYPDNDVLRREINKWLPEKYFVIKARRFEYEPNIIEVNKGDEVVIKLITEDVTHGLFIDGYEVSAVSVPKDEGLEPGIIKFKANRTGRFSFRCSRTCGSFHPYMIGYLKVNPNKKYHISAILISLICLSSILTLSFGGRNPIRNKFLGIIPLDFKFELTRFETVKHILKSRWFPLILILINIFIFTLILIAGLIGGFSAGNKNFGIVIVWILWWVLLMLFMVPLFGRIWCMMCPLPVFGEWLQRLKIVGVRTGRLLGLNKRWPNRWRNLWPTNMVFLFLTFFSAFFTVLPIATFVLLGGIIITAIIISLIFEKRTFCLFLCPVSGFQGLYANFAGIEVRVKDPSICKQHKPKTCFTGSDNAYGCPWMELPFEMNRNTYCGLCMECIKACPYDNMALNIRTPTSDFYTPLRRTDEIYNRRSWDEAFKSFIMIGAVIVFYLGMQGPYGWFKDIIRARNLAGYLSYLLLYTIFTLGILPGIFYIFSFISKKLSGKKEISIREVFVNFSYTLVPIGLARWMAFSLGIIMPNGSYLLGVVSDPFNLGWNLFGTSNFKWTPFYTGLMPYLQTIVIIIGLIISIDMGHKISSILFKDKKSEMKAWIPILVFIFLLSLFFNWLFSG